MKSLKTDNSGLSREKTIKGNKLQISKDTSAKGKFKETMILDITSISKNTISNSLALMPDVEALKENKEHIEETNFESKGKDLTREVIEAVLDKSDKSWEKMFEKAMLNQTKQIEELFGKIKKESEEKK